VKSKNVKQKYKIILLNLFLLSVFSCTMNGENPFSTKKYLSIQYPPENALIRNSFTMNGRILTNKALESIEVTFTEIGKGSPKKYGPFPAVIDQTENKWSIDLNTIKNEAYPIPDGKYDVSVESVDINLSKSYLSTTYSIDNTPPVVVLTTPVSEDYDDPWEFSSNLLFAGSVYDANPSVALLFSFFDENGEPISDYRTEVDTEEWMLSIDKTDDLYKELVDSRAEYISFTVEAEDRAREYTEFSENATTKGNTSEGFYLAQDFDLEEKQERIVPARTLYAVLNDMPLRPSEMQFVREKEGLFSKKITTSEVNSHNLTRFTIRESGDVPFIQSLSLLPQQSEKVLLKNTVSAKESLFFEFCHGVKGSNFLEDMAYSLKRKEGEEWVSVLETGRKIQTVYSATSKIDIDSSSLVKSKNMIYVHEAPEVLGDYMLELFIRDTDGLYAQNALWYFTVVEPSPSLFVELKEIKSDASGTVSLVMVVNSFTNDENTFLNVKNFDGFFDSKLKDIRANKKSIVENDLFLLSWDLDIKAKVYDTNLSNLIFEVKNTEGKNNLYKNFSSVLTKDDILHEEDSIGHRGGEVESKKIDTIKPSFPVRQEASFLEEGGEEKIISYARPSLNLQAGDIPFDMHFDSRGEYFNLGYLHGKTIIPLEVNESVTDVFIKDRPQNSRESLDVSIVQVTEDIWQLVIIEPKTSMQGLVELVAVNKDGFEVNLRLKMLYDRDAPVVKADLLKNNFYNKKQALHISGFCIDHSQGFPQSGLDSIIEYTVLKGDYKTLLESDTLQSITSWEKAFVADPLRWDIFIEPSVFDDDGWYTIVVRGKDTSENYSLITETSLVPLYVDSHAPAIKILSEGSVSFDFEEELVVTEVLHDEFFILNLEGFIEEKTFEKNGLAYWAYEKYYISGDTMDESLEIVDLIQNTVGNYWVIEDTLKEKGRYKYVLTAKDLSGNSSSVVYSILLK
jgi:hypothetical protein